MRKPVIAGNWKMNKTAAQAVFILQELENLVEDAVGVEIVVAPPFIALRSLEVVIEQDKPNIHLAAQNMHWEEEGAYTGEISPLMLLDVGVKYVIIGHSERRQLFGETDENVNRKVKSALAHDLIPIMCCGETLDERESGRTESVIERQVRAGLQDLSASEVAGLIVAYEPIWAIGTGKTATPEQANETVAFVRGVIKDMTGETVSEEVRILYGGSVKPDNIDSLMAMSDIDGALVGGACLEPASFARIVKFNG
ncbi:MAG: triose-phosphate isomerase [Actinomycetota bacterium]